MTIETVARFVLNIALVFGLFGWNPVRLGAQQPTQEAMPGHPSESRNMRLVGFHDLQNRSAYQPVIHRQGDRWIAYVGLHGGTSFNPITGRVEGSGTMIVDVTDPAHPVSLSHIPWNRSDPASSHPRGSQMSRACTMGGKSYLLRSAGVTRHEIWNVTAPSEPQFIGNVVDGLEDTHKSWWECDTGIAYVVGADPSWRTRRTARIFDLSDPENPKYIRDFGLVGQEPGSQMEHVPAGGEGGAGMHGPIVLNGRVYFAHGPQREGILQIVDREKLLKGNPEPTPANLLYPEIGRLDIHPGWGVHTAFPVLGIEIPNFRKNRDGRVRDFVVAVSEVAGNNCQGFGHLVLFVDITDPTRPTPVSNFQVPESPGNFCERGGRFGPHATNESFTPIYYKKIVFVSWFNAGVRAIDIRDPFNPQEVAYYIPATTAFTARSCVTIDGQERCKVANQTNNVEVDDRGYIYIVDRANTGMHILELTGAARSIVDIP